jgi:uncharacterized membrane protein required for colicin V production
MLTFITVFGVLVAILGVVGSMRGWAKELVNTAGVILALFMYDFLVNQTGIVRGFLEQMILSDPEVGQRTVFFLITGLFLLVVLVSYLGPVAARAISSRAGIRPRETLQDALLGLILGLLNGYLIVGTVWFFLEITGYPFPESMMIRPQAGTPSAEFAMHYLPLVWMTPYLTYLLIISVLFLLVVFV